MSVHITHNEGRIKITFRSHTVQINEGWKKFVDPNFGSKPVGPTSEPGGGADLGMCGPKDPFSCLSHNFHSSHFKQTSLKISLQDPILGSLALKPQIWNFKFTRPSFIDKNQFTSPTFQKSEPHTLPEKSWVPQGFRVILAESAWDKHGSSATVFRCRGSSQG